MLKCFGFLFRSGIGFDSCTISGCNFPQNLGGQFTSSRSSKRKVSKNGRLLTCDLRRAYTTGRKYEVECKLRCRRGWRPKNNLSVTTCHSGLVQYFLENPKLRKTTNFTTDYLECIKEAKQPLDIQP